MAGFDITEWSDYIRGVADPALKRQIREYLRGRSSEPLEARMLRRIAAVARADEELAIPEHALRIARAAGSIRRPEARSEEGCILRRILPFKVLFDSLTEPATAGTRGPETSSRHVILEAERFTVDMRLERQPDPRLTVRPGGFGGNVLSGQVLRREPEAQPVPRTPILVFSGDDIVSAAVSSPLGEFHAEGLPDEPLNVCLILGHGECIEVPLGSEPALAS